MYYVIEYIGAGYDYLAQYEHELQAKIWCLLHGKVYRYRDRLYLDPQISIIKGGIDDKVHSAEMPEFS